MYAIHEFICQGTCNDVIFYKIKLYLMQGHLDIVKYLSESGADINIADNDGITPVYVAAQNVRTRIGHDDWTCVYS